MRYSNFAGRDIAMMKFRRQIKTGPSDSQVGRQSHYETLDLLRGVVAISVVLYHFSSRVNYAGLMYHGYLAVDFFFCLSGYVIFHAYFNRIRSNVMTVSEFIAARLIRFMPLVLLGMPLQHLPIFFGLASIILLNTHGIYPKYYLLIHCLFQLYIKLRLNPLRIL